MDEHQPGLPIANTDRQTFPGLACPMRLERRHRHRGERPGVETSHSWVRSEPPPSPRRRVSAHRQSAGVEVHVDPGQPERLRTPQSGRQEQRPESDEVIVGSVSEELRHVGADQARTSGAWRVGDRLTPPRCESPGPTSPRLVARCRSRCTFPTVSAPSGEPSRFPLGEQIAIQAIQMRGLNFWRCTSPMRGPRTRS